MKVGSGVSLDGRSIAARGGPAGRRGHHRPAQLPGAHLNGRDNSGDTLAAYGMKVSDRVFLDGGLTAAGTLSFASARFGESVEFKPAALAGEGRIARAQIAGALWWAPTAQVSGRVDLEGAAFGELADDWGAERESANGYWAYRRAAPP
jgi:hypothetical protein